MKLYRKCKKRIAKKYLGKGFNTLFAEYILSLKPGDWISGCRDWPNPSQVASIRCFWQRISSKARVLEAVRFLDKNGISHEYPGGGCVDSWDAGKHLPGYVHNPDIQTMTFEEWKNTKHKTSGTALAK